MSVEIVVGLGVGVAVEVGVGVAVAVGIAVGVAAAVGVEVKVRVGLGIAVGLGVAYGHDSLPIVIKVPGELWLLYSLAIQPWERTPAATWTSSVAPLYRLPPCWPDMSKSAVERIEAVKLSNCVFVAFAIPSS